ncbi:hypothetical protein HKX48_007250 [Thoreauomyces humboldtii]|nr:hypothetical protein HKX48_007250 [Thoreauomyces humboldtii]
MATEIQHPTSLNLASYSKNLPVLPSLYNRPALLDDEEIDGRGTRHARCTQPSENPTGRGEAGATPIVRCSRGPGRDPRGFYSTAYSTTHNSTYWGAGDVRNGTGNLFGYGLGSAGKNNNPVGFFGYGVNGVLPDKTPSMMKKERTGFAYNVSPFVEYDKKVDEGPRFR